MDGDLLERLEHIVLSHQGELEWGAAVIAATGLFTPAESISNAELVTAFNAYVERFNYRPAVLLSAADAQAAGVEEVSGVPLRVEGYIRPNNFWPGE